MPIFSSHLFCPAPASLSPLAQLCVCFTWPLPARREARGPDMLQIHVNAALCNRLAHRVQDAGKGRGQCSRIVSVNCTTLWRELEKKVVTTVGR